MHDIEWRFDVVTQIGSWYEVKCQCRRTVPFAFFVAQVLAKQPQLTISSHDLVPRFLELHFSTRFRPCRSHQTQCYNREKLNCAKKASRNVILVHCFCESSHRTCGNKHSNRGNHYIGKHCSSGVLLYSGYNNEEISHLFFAALSRPLATTADYEKDILLACKHCSECVGLYLMAWSFHVAVLPSYQRPLLFLPALPALVRMCRAFPPLAEDVAVLLLQLGRVCLSQECTAAPPQLGFSANQLDKCGANTDVQGVLEQLPTNSALCRAIQKSFADLCDSAVLSRTIY